MTTLARAVNVLGDTASSRKQRVTELESLRTGVDTGPGPTDPEQTLGPVVSDRLRVARVAASCLSDGAERVREIAGELLATCVFTS